MKRKYRFLLKFENGRFMGENNTEVSEETALKFTQRMVLRVSLHYSNIGIATEMVPLGDLASQEGPVDISTFPFPKNENSMF